MRRFFDEGQPGEKLKPQFDRMLNALQVPKAIYDAELDHIMRFVESTLESAGGEPAGKHAYHTDVLSLAEEGEQSLSPDQKTMREVYAEGFYSILPSFFRTIQYLTMTKRDFAIVFRTFGTDLENVVWEFNKYCSGEHICFNGKNGTHSVRADGTHGTRDMRLNTKPQLGLYYRAGRSLSDARLVTGSLNRVSDEY